MLCSFEKKQQHTINTHNKDSIVFKTILKPGVVKAISDVCVLRLGVLCTWPVRTCSPNILL